MKVVTLEAPGGLDKLQLQEREAPGEIRVRLHASSLNFHDYLVVTGAIPTANSLTFSPTASTTPAASCMAMGIPGLGNV